MKKRNAAIIEDYARNLIVSVHEQLNAGHRARAIDAVYDAVDSLLLAKSFEDAAVVITAIIQGGLPLPILLSVLVILKPWRDILHSVHLDLVESIRLVAMKEGGEDKVKAVLSGRA